MKGNILQLSAELLSLTDTDCSMVVIPLEGLLRFEPHQSGGIVQPWPTHAYRAGSGVGPAVKPGTVQAFIIIITIGFKSALFLK